MNNVLSEIRKCDICASHLPLGPNPIVSASVSSRIAIIGQAPGTKVHSTNVPWNDPSGKALREWMGISDGDFYNEELTALVPMGFCYPGRGKSGDLPPRPECAAQWHSRLFDKMHDVELILLIGQYAQKYYLKDKMKQNLTRTVEHYSDYLPDYFPLPHPSPRNRFWLKKNPWFEAEVIPDLQKVVSGIINK